MAEGGSGAASSDSSRITGAPATSVADRRVQALTSHLRSSGSTRDQLVSLSESIADMKKEQLRMREERKRAAKELKNAQRRKRRLKTKARQLSNEDLLAVLMLRNEGATEQNKDGGAEPSRSLVGLSVEGPP